MSERETLRSPRALICASVKLAPDAAIFSPMLCVCVVCVGEREEREREREREREGNRGRRAGGR